ncbi:MAG: hypothetical protein WHS44_01810 [Fimbriimonadales bacterium]|nr:MAG: hypothetical protein KatS3mg018_0550 [Fimbriimonadales bacterium]
MSRARELIQDFVNLLEEDEDLQLEFARAFLTSRTLRRLLSDSNLQDTLRKAVMTDALLQVPEKIDALASLIQQNAQATEQRFNQVDERFDRVEARVDRLEQTTEQRFNRVDERFDRVEARVDRLEQTTEQRFNRVDERFDRVEARVDRLEQTTEQRFNQVDERIDRLDRMVAELREMVEEQRNWQQGEIARRKGEDYERSVVRRARRIFGYGQGGSPREDSAVRNQVLLWLDQAGLLDEDISEADDPLEADLIWWKDNRVVLAEISVKVDRYDVQRARRRAEVLRRAGFETLAVVIGAQWAHRQTPRTAQKEGVEFVVKGVYSQGVIAFRRYRPA